MKKKENEKYENERDIKKDEKWAVYAYNKKQ